MKGMNKKVVIAGAVLVIFVVGILYMLGASVPSPEEGYSTTPTQWSQEGDYRIEETSEGTVVTNEKAGFSFKVPKGWSLEGGSFGEMYSLDLISPNAVIQNGVFLENGCISSVETQSNKDFVTNVNQLIGISLNSVNAYPDKTVINLDNQVALKTTVINEGKIYSEVVSIEAPLTAEELLAISFTERSLSKGLCTESFDSILASFIFE